MRRLKVNQHYSDIFDGYDFEKEEKAYVEPKEWTIITALDRILDMARGSELSDEIWSSVKNPLAYLRERLELTDIQIVLVAIMAEAGEPLSWRKFGNFFHSSRLSTMCYSEEMEELLAKRWVIRRGTYEKSGFSEGFTLEHGVVTALRHNKTFVPEKLDCFNEQQFMDKLESQE